MDQFLNHIRGVASQLDYGWGFPRLGTIASVDPQTQTARAHVQPEGTLTGWLPVSSLWVGNGWGMICPPSPGDQVIILWQEGDADQGIIVTRLWSQMAQPPPVPCGELWLQHGSGCYLRLKNDGVIQSGGGNWMHAGDLYVSGHVYDSHGSMDALRAHYNQHVHPPSEAGPVPID